METSSPFHRKHTTLKVLFLAAEADPLIKVGGLGDVSGSLPRALNNLVPSDGNPKLEIIVAMPFHSGINRAGLQLGSRVSFTVASTDGQIPGEATPVSVAGINFLLISGPPVPKEGPVYSMDTQADGEKFTFAALGALEAVRAMNWQPDILHANDWHTAMAVYAASVHREYDPFFQHMRSILTVHNMPFIGVGTSAALEKFGLPPLKVAGLPWWAEQLPLPLGLATADRIVAVSPGYSQEILTPAYGNGLEGLLQKRRKFISGILNGIDEEMWNPKTDTALTACYDMDSLEIRARNKEYLLQTFSFYGDTNLPLMTYIGRMDPQKGIDLVMRGVPKTADRDWRIVILGTGDEILEAEARALEQAFPDRVRAVLRFDNTLARQLYAGSDILLMPSRYEPCGLAQMIAMRYGCVPLARSTGGLKDTISPYPKIPNGTGFLFEKATPEDLASCINQALDIFSETKAWRNIQLNGMQKDFSWHCSAHSYAQLYNQMREGL